MTTWEECFKDTNIKLGDYIRLRTLRVGDIIHLKNDGDNVRIIIIGNATPFNGVSSNSDDGWDWGFYNNWEILKVEHLEFVEGRYMDPKYVESTRKLHENIKQTLFPNKNYHNNVVSPANTPAMCVLPKFEGKMQEGVKLGWPSSIGK